MGPSGTPGARRHRTCPSNQSTASPGHPVSLPAPHTLTCRRNHFNSSTAFVQTGKYKTCTHLMPGGSYHRCSPTCNLPAIHTYTQNGTALRLDRPPWHMHPPDPRRLLAQVQSHVQLARQPQLRDLQPHAEGLQQPNLTQTRGQHSLGVGGGGLGEGPRMGVKDMESHAQGTGCSQGLSTAWRGRDRQGRGAHGEEESSDTLTAWMER